MRAVVSSVLSLVKIGSSLGLIIVLNLCLCHAEEVNTVIEMANQTLGQSESPNQAQAQRKYPPPNLSYTTDQIETFIKTFTTIYQCKADREVGNIVYSYAIGFAVGWFKPVEELKDAEECWYEHREKFTIGDRQRMDNARMEGLGDANMYCYFLDPTYYHMEIYDRKPRK